MNAPSQNYDLILAGGGLAGILTALRIQHARPDLRLALIDKNPSLGGRVGMLHHEDVKSVYGLHMLSKKLLDFVRQTLRLDPDWNDEASLLGQAGTFAFLSAGKLAKLDSTNLFAKEAVMRLGGAAASKGWDEFEAMISAHASALAEGGPETATSKSFAKTWTQARKTGASVVLEMLAGVVGIPDLWTASAEAVLDRALQVQDGMYSASIVKLFAQLLAMLQSHPNTDLHLNCRLLEAKFEDGIWQLESEVGPMHCRTLIVCQSVWDADEWLPPATMPKPMISLASKTQPVSLVSIWSARQESEVERVPEMVYVPSEGAMIHLDPKQLSAQCAIPFEWSLDAPNVVKAIKRLKRAKKKLLQHAPDLGVAENEQIALLSSAWTQSVHASDHRYLHALKIDQINDQHLCFCGDAYGPSYDYDLNLIRSVLSTCETVIAAAQGSLYSARSSIEVPSESASLT